MKVLHVVEPFSSGIITFIITLAGGMQDFDHYVLHGSRVSEDKAEKVKQRFPKETKFIDWKNAQRTINPIRDLQALIGLYKTIKNLRPNVIHLHSSKAGFLGRLVGTMFPCIIIYTPNGAAFNREDINYFTKLLYQFVEKFAGILSGKVICCSKSEMDSYRRVGIPSTYINNGIKIKKFYKPTTNRKLVIGCMALVTEQKNPGEFNKIAEYFIDNDNVEFLWIGDGNLRSQLKSQNIKITGWVDELEGESYLSNVDIYLSCSLWEGLPFSVLEAMNNEICLVLRNCVGNKDLVREGFNGKLFNETEHAIQILEELLVDKSRIELLGINSKELLKRDFNANNMTNAYTLEYEKD